MTPSIWMKELTGALDVFGRTPTQWEIYRGDSFQLEVMPEDAFYATMLIKANVKQFDPLNVRLAIGIGEKEHTAEKITASNGTAFIYSGECFDGLKKQTLAIRSPWKTMDESLNISFELASLIMDHWTPASSEAVAYMLANPEINQEMAAKKLRKSQSTISEALNRAGFKTIMKLEGYFRRIIQEKTQMNY